jgi:hypothetical protein
VEGKGLTMIEACMGFSVVVDPRTSAYISTVRSPGIIFERLSKEEVKVADGPLRLLETMKLDINFRKTLTRKTCFSRFLKPLSFCLFIAFAWGVLVYENLYALNVLTKGTLSDTLSRREWRLIFALMVRENLNVCCCLSIFCDQVTSILI